MLLFLDLFCIMQSEKVPNAKHLRAKYAISSMPSFSSSSSVSFRAPLPTWLASNQTRPILCPPTFSHAIFNSTPYPLDHLSVPPPALLAACPLVDPYRQHTTPQTNDIFWWFFIAPAHIYARIVAEQFSRVRILVRFELPCLAGGEDCDNTAPICRFERGGAVDKDKCQR